LRGEAGVSGLGGVPHSCGADGQVLEGFLERCVGELDLAEAEAVKFAELQVYKKHIDAQLEAGAGALIFLVSILRMSVCIIRMYVCMYVCVYIAIYMQIYIYTDSRSPSSFYILMPSAFVQPSNGRLMDTMRILRRKTKKTKSLEGLWVL
jgi:hypothetical protein